MTESLMLRLYASPVGLYLTAEGRLDATTAHQLGRAVAVALDRGDNDRITVDLSGIRRIDVAAVTLLRLLRTAALLRGVTMIVACPSACVRGAIRAARAEELLAPPAADTAPGYVAAAGRWTRPVRACPSRAATGRRARSRRVPPPAW